MMLERRQGCRVQVSQAASVPLPPYSFVDQPFSGSCARQLANECRQELYEHIHEFGLGFVTTGAQAVASRRREPGGLGTSPLLCSEDAQVLLTRSDHRHGDV